MLFLCQSTNKLLKPIYQSTNQPTYLPTNPPTNKSVWCMQACFVMLFLYQSTNKLLKPTYRSTNHPTYKPTQPTINKSVQVAMKITEYRTGDYRSAAPDFSEFLKCCFVAPVAFWRVKMWLQKQRDSRHKIWHENTVIRDIIWYQNPKTLHKRVRNFNWVQFGAINTLLCKYLVI